MKNSENRKFEESWRDAFSNAEMNPSDGVWDGIELHLSKAESGTMKRRVIFYQRLAAASVLLAVFLGGAGIWYWASDNTQNSVAVVPNQELDVADLNTTEGVGSQHVSELKGVQESSSSNYASTPGELTAVSNRAGENRNGKNPSTISNAVTANLTANNSIVTTGSEQSNQYIVAQNESNKVRGARLFPTLASEELPEVEIKVNGEPARMIASPKKFKNATPEKPKTKEESGWWASVGGAAGSYNPNSSAAMDFSKSRFTQGMATSNTLPSTSEASLGTAFSYGLNVGKKIAKRWVIVTGLSYLNQSIGYNSNIAALDANNQAQAFVADMRSQSATLTTTTPYSINSVSEFLSVPLQAGYLLVDKKIGVQLNAGVSSDFFVKNTLVDEGGKLASYSVGAGDNSSYQSINWTGVTSTELSYKVSSHYRVSLLPGLRYGFNPVLKSGGSTPIVWDIGFRFRYVF